uniref:protein disulfide-isomerase n=1 Tax=Entamoeba invadens TaxID=33085 RepID=S0B4Q1_ENTIV|nr:protein disulfide isomerase, putative [Entamoeba invadens]
MGVLLLLATVLCTQASVVSLNPTNFNNIVDGTRHVFVKFFAPWCGHCKKLAPEYVKLADKYKSNDNIVIAELDCDNKDHKDLCGKFGISGFPTLKFFAKGTTDAIDYNGDRSFDDLVKFIDEKTQPKVASNVVVVTDDTFDTIVMDPTKNVFVKFYAPWCGHCKALAPKYVELSKMYAGEDDFIMAEVDCTVNTKVCGKYEVHGYPTLKSFPKATKTGIAYEGNREVKDFVAYFNTNYGYDRDETGKVGKTAGRIAELDDLAKTFLKAENKEELIKKAMETVGSNYYVKVMKRIVEKGEGYIKTEKERIEKMLSGSNLKAKKVDDFNKNLNVLEAF